MSVPLKMKAIGFTQSLAITEQKSLFEFETNLPELKNNDLLGRVDLCCTNFTQQYIGSHIKANASDTILA